jgi:hypothetical protein
MCYAQIGGLTAATFITLLLVPVIYSIFVLDLKLIKWDRHEEAVIEASHGLQPAEAVIETRGAPDINAGIAEMVK